MSDSTPDPNVRFDDWPIESAVESQIREWHEARAGWSEAVEPDE